MNSRALGIALLSSGLLLGLSAPAVASAPTHVTVSQAARPDVRSQAYYILDGTNSSVLASRHENTPAPIASIT